MNNEFNNQNMNENVNMMNEFQDNGGVNNNYTNNKNDKWKNILIAVLLIIIAVLFLSSVLNKKDNNVNNNDVINEIKYEIKTSDASKELYVNNKKVNGIKADSELGSIKISELKDLLIVDETNPGPSRKLFVVDKNGSSTEIDYKVSTYNGEFINTIDSYRIEGNNLYIKVNRQWGNGYIDWYCRYNDKNEVAEYEVKYEYSNGKLGNKEVLNEVTIANKYKNESCMNESNENLIATSTIAALCSSDTMCSTNNLLKDVDGSIRYYGESPNNYIIFNGEIWRIIGVFDVKKNEIDTKAEKRIKIVRAEVLENRAFDTGFSNVWKSSDLEIYLNSTSNDGYYNNLSQNSKNQIEKAVWNVGEVDNHADDVSPEGIYKLEKMSVSEGIIGLINLSDYGYASGSMCENTFQCEDSNWLSGYYSTITGYPGDDASYIWNVKNNRIIMDQVGNTSLGVLPSVYLKANVKLTGSGTISNPYKIEL